MAIAPADRGTATATNVTSVNLTPTSTPTGPVALIIHASDATGPPEPSVSGGGTGITWTRVSSIRPGARSIFVFEGQGGTFSTSNITIDWGATNVDNIVAFLVDLPGARVNARAIMQRCFIDSGPNA